MARTTNANLAAAFQYFCASAKRVGLDSSTWRLHDGNSSFGYQFRVIDGEGSTIGRDLGDSKGKAWQSLQNYADAWYVASQVKKGE